MCAIKSAKLWNGWGTSTFRLKCGIEGEILPAQTTGVARVEWHRECPGGTGFQFLPRLRRGTALTPDTENRTTRIHASTGLPLPGRFTPACTMGRTVHPDACPPQSLSLNTLNNIRFDNHNGLGHSADTLQEAPTALHFHFQPRLGQLFKTPVANSRSQGLIETGSNVGILPL